MDGDQGLVQAQHDQGQEEAAEKEPGGRAAVRQQPVGGVTDPGGHLTGEEHQAEQGRQSGHQHRDGGGHQDVEGLGHPAPAPLLHVHGEPGGTQGAEHTALAG
ncbi:hypothetical protein SHKM778_42800 [Streptomyces sp. KM77-8]|uniref:Uncharacterized protein n=1 Tax=Streptomyces haneummycinicus TaxID=3074435 RepID=A0AAT9HKE6_9ACTN